MKMLVKMTWIAALLAPTLSGAAPADSDFVERVAYYSLADNSLDQAVAYSDEKDSALFHIYTAEQADFTKSRAESPYVYRKVDMLFKDGELRPGSVATLEPHEITTQFSDVDDFNGEAEEHAAKGSGIYTLLRGVRIDNDSTIDVTVGPSGETRFMSHLIVHYKGHTKSFDYYSIIRRVFPIPLANGKVYIGVIADNCGNGGCVSDIEVLRFTK